MRPDDSVDPIIARLDELRSGRRSVEECAAAGFDAADLRAYRNIVDALRVPPVEPDARAIARGRAALLAAIADRPHSRTSFWRSLENRFAPRIGSRLVLRPILVSALVVAIAVFAGGGVVAASAGALPTEPLYPVKTFVEDARLTLAFDDDARAQLRVLRAGVRLGELRRATELGWSVDGAAAGESFAREVGLAGNALATATSAGRDTNATASRLAAELAARQSDLAALPATAPGVKVARRAVDEALANDRLILNTAATPQPNPTDVPATDDRPTATLLPAPSASAVAPSPLATAEPTATSAPDTSRTENGEINGLLATLEAARSSIGRGKAGTAENQLNALRNELDARLRSGKITEGEYATLYAEYVTLSSSAAAQPDPPATPTASAPTPAPIASAAPAATTAPTTVPDATSIPTPNTQPENAGKSGNGNAGGNGSGNSAASSSGSPAANGNGNSGANGNAGGNGNGNAGASGNAGGNGSGGQAAKSPPGKSKP